jgi:hypothetical protein
MLLAFPTNAAIILAPSDITKAQNPITNSLQGEYPAALEEDSLNVRQIGWWPFGPSAAVAVDEAREVTFLSSFAGIYVLDTTDPTQPQKLSEISTKDGIRHIFYCDGYLYVADSYAGLRIISVSDLSNPVEVGYYDTPDHAYSVVVSDGYAYVADWEGGLRVVSVSDPSNPVEVGYCDIDHAQGIDARGDYVYIADRYDGLRVISVSDPNNPIEVGYYDFPFYGDTNGVAVSGDFAYIAHGVGLRVISAITRISQRNGAAYESSRFRIPLIRSK